jgi:DNA polymerase
MPDEEGIVDASYLTFKGRNKIYGGLFLENVVQCLARIMVGNAMREVATRYRVVMSTHDELVALVPDAEADDALEWFIQIMSTPPIWALDIPLAAEGSHDQRYGK